MSEHAHTGVYNCNCPRCKEQRESWRLADEAQAKKWELEAEAREAAYKQNVEDAEARLARGEASIYELELPTMGTRAQNVFNNQGIGTIEQLATKTEEEVSKWRNMGAKTIAETRAALQARGLDLQRAVDVTPRRVAELERQLSEARAEIERLKQNVAN